MSRLGCFNPTAIPSVVLLARKQCGVQAAAAAAQPSPQPAYPQHLISAVLSGYLAPYFEATPSAEVAISELEQWLPDDAQIGFDHIAFRTFGMEHYGIASISQWFLDLGYRESHDVLEFEKKKVRARWYSPPSPELPRVFISELKVDELTLNSQQIIQKYTTLGNGGGGNGGQVFGRFGPLTGFFGVTPWQCPTFEDYMSLLDESEYAAWVLVNGYFLNHAAIAVHRLNGLDGGLEAVVARLKERRGLRFNQEGGGEIKISPDGLLLQSSTVADGIEFNFSCGETQLVAGAYVEFAERLVLPEYAHHLTKGEPFEEWHRRDGFEVLNAETLFESTKIESNY